MLAEIENQIYDLQDSFPTLIDDEEQRQRGERELELILTESIDVTGIATIRARLKFVRNLVVTAPLGVDRVDTKKEFLFTTRILYAVLSSLEQYITKKA